MAVEDLEEAQLLGQHVLGAHAPAEVRMIQRHQRSPAALLALLRDLAKIDGKRLGDAGAVDGANHVAEVDGVHVDGIEAVAMRDLFAGNEQIAARLLEHAAQLRERREANLRPFRFLASLDPGVAEAGQVFLDGRLAVVGDVEPALTFGEHVVI